MFATLIYYIFFILTAYSDDLLTDVEKEVLHVSELNQQTIICLLPETGIHTDVGNEVKDTVNIYLNHFTKNTNNLIFLNENLNGLGQILLNNLKYDNSARRILGPILSNNTKKLSSALTQNSNWQFYSLSNDLELKNFNNVKIFGYSLYNKLEYFMDEVSLEGKDYHNFHIIYHKKGFPGNFDKNLSQMIYKKIDKKPIISGFNTIQDFSFILKNIPKQKQHNIKSKNVIIFANLDLEIMKSIYIFLKKYKLTSEEFDFYFLADFPPKTKIDKEYLNSFYIIEYDFNKYKKFNELFLENFGKFPSKISYAAFDALNDIFDVATDERAIIIKNTLDPYF